MMTSTIALNPENPFNGRIPGGFTQGATLQVDGVVSPGGDPFHLTIQDTWGGGGMRPLHLSVRQNEGCIVRNHCANGSWGTEERDGGMPIHPGKHFRLTIDAGGNEFIIRIDGVFFATFRYRLGLETAQFLNFHGGVQIFNIVLANHGAPPHIQICPPFHPDQHPMHPIAPVHPGFPPHHHHGPPHHHHGPPHHQHGPPHGCCQKTKKDKKKDKKQKKKDKKKRRGSSSSSSSSSSSD